MKTPQDGSIVDLGVATLLGGQGVDPGAQSLQK